MELSIETLISASSAVAALLSALYAIRSSRVAQRALEIAEHDHQAKKESLKLYLIDGFNYKNSDNKYIFAFNATVTNLSSENNSIERLELVISFIRKDNTLGHIILQHNDSLYSSLKGIDVTPFKLPHEVGSKAAISHWCLFLFSKEFLSNNRIDKYTIRVTDTAGNMSEKHSYLVKEYHRAQ